MPRTAKELSVRAVDALTCNTNEAGEPVYSMHAVGGISGLYLAMWPDGRKSWIYRSTFNGRRIKRGVGSYPKIGLGAARKAARAIAESLLEGVDPRETRRAQAAAKSRQRTFKQVSEEFLNEVVYQRKNANQKNLAQWGSTLSRYAYPYLGSMDVAEVTSADVAAALRPIWSTKTDTADKLKSRIKGVMAHAIAKGYVPDYMANPASSDRLRHLLPAKKDVHVKGKQPYLHLTDVQRFWRDLSAQDDIRAKCLALALLTATRSDSIRGARWEEFDLDSKRWTIPATRMKGGRPFVVALSDTAIDVLRTVPQDHECLFRTVTGKAPHDSWLRLYLRDVLHRQSVSRGEGGFVDPEQRGIDGQPKVVVPHGFRATFETWAVNETRHDQVTIDIALDHKTSQDMHDHYLRSDAFNKRLELMNDFSRFASGAVK